MGKYAFHLCTRLTSVTFLGDAPEEVGRVFFLVEQLSMIRDGRLGKGSKRLSLQPGGR